MPVIGAVGPTVHYLTTELDAVNIMLSTIGEAPVNELSGAMPVDVATAYNILRKVTREVQLEGWHFNTEDNYPLIPDAYSGHIFLPMNTIRVSLADPDMRDVVQRGQKLYDRANHTYAFSRTLIARITLLLSFDEMPEAFRNYVAVKASREFQVAAVGSSELHSFTAEAEQAARIIARRDDVESSRPSLAKGAAFSFLSGWRVGQTLER